MIPYKVNGAKINIPSSWDDMSFNQYSAILTNDVEKPDANLNILAICLKIPVETLKNSKLENVETLYSILAFLKTPAKVDPQPTKIDKYIIPKDITFEYLNQFEDMRKTYDQAIKKVKGETDLFKIIPVISEYYPVWAAIYCQRIRDGEYNYEKAMAMVEELKEASCMEILSTGTFFFYRLTSSLTGMRPSFPRIIPSLKRKMQALRNFTRRLGLTSRSAK